MLVSLWSQDGCCFSRHGICIPGRGKEFNVKEKIEKECQMSLSIGKTFPRRLLWQHPFISHSFVE